MIGKPVLLALRPDRPVWAQALSETSAGVSCTSAGDIAATKLFESAVKIAVPIADQDGVVHPRVSGEQTLRRDPLWGAKHREMSFAGETASGAERKCVALPTDFRSPRKNGRQGLPQSGPPSDRSFPWYKEACAQGADGVDMQRSAWVAVLLVVLAGWGIAALMAITLVLLVGWLGILIIGLAICFCAAQAGLDDQAPVASVTLLRRQYAQTFEGTAEERLAKWARRVEHNKGLYIARTVGIAAILIGFNMFIMHQL